MSYIRNMKKLTQAERLARLADRAEDRRINQLFEQGSMARPQLQPEPVAEPASYRVTRLTSAVTTKARGAKAAATRRANAARKARG